MNIDNQDAESSSLGLARFCSQLGIEDIPPDVVEWIKLCLLDTLGCGLYGSGLRWTHIVRETLLAVDRSGEVQAWGGTDQLSAPHAALLNGTAVHAFELDDLHARSIVHPGSVVAPAALAAAATTSEVTGADLIVGLVAGYEAAARVGMTMGAAHLLAGWHPTGTHGALGAAAAAGSILRIDPEQMRNAFGTAGSMSAGLMAAQYESMVKRLHAGRAAQSGLYAALLSARGFLGIADLFEADYGGYGTTFSSRFDPEPLTADLGDVWQTREVGFKPYSCNGSCHPTVDIIRSLRDSAQLRPEQVARIDVFVSTATVKHVGWHYVPGSVTTAQMNLPYITAVTLTDGDAFVDQFTDERVIDPLLIEFAGRVHVHADAEIDARGDSARHTTRLQVTLHDGRSLEESRDYAYGSSRAPMSRPDVEQKYERLAGAVLPDRSVTELRELVGELETLPDVGRLSALLRVDKSTVA